MTARYRVDVPERPDDGRRWLTEEGALAYADRLIQEGARTCVVWETGEEVSNVPQTRAVALLSDYSGKVAPESAGPTTGPQIGSDGLGGVA